MVVEYIKETRILALGITMFLILTLIAVIAIALGFMLPESDKPEVWFQRSGSIVVLVALFLEFFVQQRLLAFRNGKVPPWEASLIYKTYFHVLAIICVVYGLVGTFIWGYGDLVYLQFT